jgi:hypothetical protein
MSLNKEQAVLSRRADDMRTAQGVSGAESSDTPAAEYGA